MEQRILFNTFKIFKKGKNIRFTFICKSFLLAFLFLNSCQTEDNKDRIITFDLKELPEISNVKLSDLGFIDIQYIPLETSNHCVIAGINDIKFGNDFFLTQFFNTIFKFKNNGSFVDKIGTEGRGPEEFEAVHDLDIDNINHVIYLVSGWQKKFYVYTEDGQFIRTFQSPLNTINFKVTESGLICYSTNYIANIEYSYNLIDIDGRIIKNFPNKYHWKIKSKSGTAIFDENLFYRFNSKLYKKEVYSDTVYVFENPIFKPHLVIEHGEKLLTTNARSEYEPSILFKKVISQKNIFEFGDYIYYEFITSLNGKSEFLSLIGSKKNGFQALVDPGKGFINDLDGGPNIWPKTIRDDNTIITWVDALQLKNHIASESFRNSIPKYPEKKKELEKLANNLKETDNPVLILVKLKKH